MQQDESTFSFDKPIDDIAEIILLDVDWYNVEVASAPKIQKNNALYTATSEDTTAEEIEQLLAENEKMGYNLVVTLAVEHSEQMFNGRKLTVWLPWPSEPDHDRFDQSGRNKYDAKMERVGQFVASFGGEFESDGKSFRILPGMKGQAYVIQNKPPGREEFVNSVDLFAGFREYGA
jgi:hypothetical protein